MERSNLSREIKFSGVNGDMKNRFDFPCSADYEQDWQPCSIDPYSV